MKLNNNDDSHNSGLNLLIYNMLLDIESHPAWVCGLKQILGSYETLHFYVTPCVGVWIETALPCLYTSVCMSHPAWVCGLKLGLLLLMVGMFWSHPAWVCGLKLSMALEIILSECHTLRGCVD